MNRDNDLHEMDGAYSAGTRDGELRLLIPPTASYIAMARLFAAAAARQHGCSEEVIEDLKIAISETVTNAVKAHERTGETDLITITVHRQGSTLTFDVVDRGDGFDLEPGEPQTMKSAALHHGSLGLALVRTMFPETHVRRNADRGMTVGFSITLDAAPA